MPRYTFEEFGNSWSRDRLKVPISEVNDGFLERRAVELLELAVRNGYRFELESACSSYPTTAAYVRELQEIEAES